MSETLGVTKALELVERLKRTIEDFSVRADRLTSDLNSRITREKARRQAALDEETRGLESRLAAAGKTFQIQKAETEQNYENRKKRIGRAYQSSKELRLKQIEDRTGGRKFELQRAMLQAERNRDATVAQATAHVETFRAHLKEERDHLEKLEAEAQSRLSGYGRLKGLFVAAYEKTEQGPGSNQDELLASLRDLLQQSREQLARLKGNRLISLLRFWYLWLCLFLGVILAAWVLPQAAPAGLTVQRAAILGGGLSLLMLVVRFVAAHRAQSTAAQIGKTLASGRATLEACAAAAEARYQQDLQQARQEFAATGDDLDRRLKLAVSSAGQERVSARMSADERTVRITALHEENHRKRLTRAQANFTRRQEELKRETESRFFEITSATDKTFLELEQALQKASNQLAQEWEQTLGPLAQTIAQANREAGELSPPWQTLVQNWQPPKEFPHAARFGELKVDLAGLCESFPKDQTLKWPGPAQFPVPLCLTYPEAGSLIFETRDTGRTGAIDALNTLVLRLLFAAPPGRLSFTILDPVGLGQNFAGIMHLADYEEQIINSRIWTQSGQIEEKLGELNEHMEKVIQMYLRNEYATIADYNRQAGVIAEKYHFLVVADFPSGFTETGFKRLMSIAASGARCGVYLLLHWDRRLTLPQDFQAADFRKTSVCVSARGTEFAFPHLNLPGTEVKLDSPPDSEAATALVQKLGQASRDSSRVEVPFDHVAPSSDQMWSETTEQVLRVPIGRTGATKLQYFEVGKGTCQHGLVAGKTGSGKSTLFHVMVTNLSLWCSPEQVEFYLVDFKKGVEFKCYATWRLPHARVIAIESDREFGLSVLQRVDDELKRRGDMFRQLGVQDVPGYKRAGGKEAVPRSLLLIDEFQEFFVEDDRIAQTASLLLDRIVRQGRAFGIHVVLGSQTLGGAYTVARTTLGQMVIRIALECNEADAYLIMEENNPAPRLLSRPGEGIYNDSAGAIEGNSPFQVVWLSDRERDEQLARVRAHADASGRQYPDPIVFEGNAPADVQNNTLLHEVLESTPSGLPRTPRIWLGAPNSIKGPTEVAFQRLSGNHLLIVGQRDESAFAMFALGLLALSSQFTKEGASFILCDTTVPDSPQREYLDRVLQRVSQEVRRLRPTDLASGFGVLADEMKQRSDDPDPDNAPARFILIPFIQKLGKLRYEEEFGFSSGGGDGAPSPATVLNQLITEGARLGFHVIASCDTYNNVMRFMSRKALSEFELRVLFQMSANDSASLADNPKASTLGLHRALLYNAQEGHLETFRPYALPAVSWLDDVRPIQPMLAKT